ncbi:MAG: hypothetical protein WCI56_03730 [Hyphomicrobiales bacterium]
MRGLIISICLIGILCSTSIARAQRTNFQGIAECSRVASIQFKRHDHAFRRFIIDRASVTEDRFSAMVGNQFISTIYHGTATYEAGAGPRKTQFICLHAGTDKGAVFVYTLPH